MQIIQDIAPPCITSPSLARCDATPRHYDDEIADDKWFQVD